MRNYYFDKPPPPPIPTDVKREKLGVLVELAEIAESEPEKLDYKSDSMWYMGSFDEDFFQVNDLGTQDCCCRDIGEMSEGRPPSPHLAPDLRPSDPTPANLTVEHVLTAWE
jgi:hypothetical protein